MISSAEMLIDRNEWWQFLLGTAPVHTARTIKA